VLRKWSDPVDNGANLLIPVPGSGDGPGGVLVCAENFVLYRHQVRRACGACVWGCCGALCV
jgi:splicing factor 3B subunit 3